MANKKGIWSPFNLVLGLLRMVQGNVPYNMECMLDKPSSDGLCIVAHSVGDEDQAELRRVFDTAQQNSARLLNKWSSNWYRKEKPLRRNSTAPHSEPNGKDVSIVGSVPRAGRTERAAEVI